MESIGPGRHLVTGTLRGLAAESLFPITAVITAAFLTRRLGPEGYGLLALAATMVTWVELSINAFFARATIKWVSEVPDWKPVANHVARMQLASATAAMVLIWLLAWLVARVLHEPLLTPLLGLYAVHIPLFNLTQAHRNVLVGLGHFAQNAILSAVRWIARLILIVVFVEAGLSVAGAILGILGASLVALLLARRYVRPAVFGAGQRRPVRGYGVPLFVSALALLLYTRVDLFALKALGGTSDEAGFYGAAQNLSMLANLVAMSLTPVLLSTLGRLLSRGESAAAREIGRNAMRVVVALLPLAAAVAGAARELATVFFGRDFEPAAHVLAPLIFGSFATIMIQVATTIFTADGRPNGALRLTLALVPLAIAGHLLMIPRFGAFGAATVTAAVGLLGSLWAVWNVHRLWRIAPPAGTLLRSVVIGGAAFALAALWPTPGLLVFAKLAVIGGLCVLLFRGLGELNAEELAKTRAWVTKSDAAPTGTSLP